MAGFASMTDFSPSKEQDNYFRVARLLIQLGTRILRSYFDTCHPPESLAHILSNCKLALKRNRNFSKTQKLLLYPDSGDPESKHFDFTLLYQLLREICGLKEPSCKWHGFPSRDDTSIESDITRLRFYRNTYYGHVRDDMAIPSDEFHDIWNNIAEALLRINKKCTNKIEPHVLEERIWRLKYGPLTHDDKESVIKQIMEIQKVQGEAIGRMERQLSYNSETLCRMESKEDDIYDAVIKSTTKNDNISHTFTINNININNSPNLSISGNDIASNTSMLQNLQKVLMPNQQALQGNNALPQSSCSQIPNRSNNPNNQYRHSMSSPLGHPTWDATTTASSEHQRSFDKASIPHSWSEGNIGTKGDNMYYDRDNSRSAVQLSSSPAEESRSHATHDESPTAQSNSSRENVTSSHSSTVMRRCSSEGWMFPPSEPPDDVQRYSTPSNNSKSQGEPLAQGAMSYTSAALSLSFNNDESRKRGDAPQSEPILNVYIRQVIENPTKEQQNDFHLGHYINQSTMSQGCRDDHGQFKNYFEERKLKIEKVDFKEEDNTSCLMTVHAESLQSLSNFWKDYQSNDLREIIIALLPFENVGIEIDIDRKQYKQCWERMRKKDGGEQVTLSRSFNQSLSVDQASPERPDPYKQRSFSLGDLPLQKAFDKLFTLLCTRGGKMQYSEIEKSLPTNEWTKIKKALPKTMSIDKRIRVLPGNILQATMDFCPRSYGECDVECPQLHVCRYFLLGICTFPNCKNSHDISDRHTKMIFQKANLASLPQEGRLALLKSFACKIPSICRFYNKGIKSVCIKNEKCHCLHVCQNWINGQCLFSKPNSKTCNRAHTFADPATQTILQQCNLHELDDDELKEKLSKNYK